MRFDTTGGQTGTLSELVLFRLADDYFTTDQSKIDAVTREDVARVAKKYIDFEHLTILIVGDRKLIEPKLKKRRVPESSACSTTRSKKERLIPPDHSPLRIAKVAPSPLFPALCGLIKARTNLPPRVDAVGRGVGLLGIVREASRLMRVLDRIASTHDLQGAEVHRSRNDTEVVNLEHWLDDAGRFSPCRFRLSSGEGYMRIGTSAESCVRRRTLPVRARPGYGHAQLPVVGAPGHDVARPDGAGTRNSTR